MRPLLSLGSKQFLTGIAPSAHSESGGLFFNAAGVTPLFDAGAALSVNNGLLMAGAAPTTGSLHAAITGNMINSISHDGVFLSGGGMIFSTDDDEVCVVPFTSGVPSGTATQVFTAGHTLTPGLQSATLSNGLSYIFYRQIDQMGYYEPGVPTQTDAWQALSADYFGAFHFHYGLNKYIFGNGVGKLGTLTLGATIAAASFNLAALTYDSSAVCTAISDDGTYVIAAITRNTTALATPLTDTRIIFWDGSSTTGFIRDYSITDPLIYEIRKTPNGVFAFGLTGIWQITFDGVKKIFNHNPGIYIASGSVVHYGRSASFFSDALLWGGANGSSTVRTIKSLGKLDSSATSAYLQPLLSTANKNITHVNAQIAKGYVFWADDTPAFYYAQIGSGTPSTGVSAQTVYIPLGDKYEINRVDVIFGEPLVTGDSMSIQLKTDEDTTAITASTSLTASYAQDGAIRKKAMRVVGFTADEQISLVINFTAGAVKIKRIKVYGKLVPDTNT